MRLFKSLTTVSLTGLLGMLSGPLCLASVMMAALTTTTSAGFLEVGAKRTSRANKGLLGTVFKSSLSSDGHDEPDDETELLTSDAEGAEPDVTEVKPPQRPRNPPRRNPVRPSTSVATSRHASSSSFWSS